MKNNNYLPILITVFFLIPVMLVCRTPDIKLMHNQGKQKLEIPSDNDGHLLLPSNEIAIARPATTAENNGYTDKLAQRLIVDDNPVKIAKASPGGPSPNLTDSEIIRWDNGINFDIAGITGGGIFEIAAYFPASTLEQYIGMTLNLVEIYIGQNPINCTLKIYGQGTSNSPGKLLQSQPVTTTPNSWILIDLSNQVDINGQDIWISCSFDHLEGTNPAGIDAGPAIAGYGDMVSFNGGSWTTLSSLGYDFNWNIAGYLDFGGPICPTVDAGSDASLCEGGVFTLTNALAADYSGLQWTTIGDGFFDDETLLNPTYTPGQGDFANGSVELCLTGFPIDPCPVSETDCMTLTIMLAPSAFAGADATIAEAESYLISDATATNFSSLLWASSGDGMFDDASILNPTYSPGAADIVAGTIELCLIANPLSPCTTVADYCMLLTIQVIIFNDSIYAGTVTTNYNELIFSTDSIYDVVSINNCFSTDSVGAPVLPFKTLSYVIPVDKKVSSIIINSTTMQQLPGTYNIVPAQTPVITNMAPDPILFDDPDTLIYNSMDPYPGKQYEISIDGYPNGYHIVTINFYPLEYIPAAGTLNLFTAIHFTIVYENNTDTVLLPLRQSLRSNTLIKDELQNMLANPNDLDLVSGGAREIVSNGAVVSNVKGMSPSSLSYIPDYIIITRSGFVSDFQLLADWKTQKGVYTIVVETDHIFQNYKGCDNAEKIREYLKDAYVSFGITYVLLGGDVVDGSGNELIPARLTPMYLGLFETDFYYETVQGDWNGNKNSIFGEGGDQTDLSPVFKVGRAPIHNTAEATNFVNKILGYEKLDNPLTSNKSYVNNLSFWCGNDGGPQPLTRLNGIDDFANGGYLDPSKYHVLKLYDPLTLSLNGRTAPLDRNNVLFSMNYGWSNFSPPQPWGNVHIIYHCDHSGSNTMGTSTEVLHQSIYRSDMDDLINLTNGAYYPQILYSDGCHANQFSLDCISEHYINNPFGGGVAFLGNSDVGLWGDDSYFKYYFCQSLYAPISLTRPYPYLNFYYHIGYLNQISTVDPIRKVNRSLLGDPEMMVWTDKPISLTVASLTYLGTSKLLTGTISGFSNNTSQVVVTICIWKRNEIYQTQEITISNSSPLSFSFSNVDPDTPGNITVTVVAHNYIPNISTVPVPPITGPHPYMSKFTIDDSNPGTGNNDGFPDAGETIKLPIVITNSGNMIANNITAILSWTATSYQNPATVTITTNSCNFGSIGAGQTGNNNSAPFEFTINKDAFENPNIIPRPLTQFIDFTLAILVGGNPFSTKSFSILIDEPKIVKGENTVTGTLTANSTNSLKIKLYNDGLAQAVGLNATLSSTSLNITITTPTSSYLDIDGVNSPSNNGINGIPFTFTMGSSPYSNEPFTLTVTNKYGKTWTFNNISLTPPVILPTSTIAHFGYQTSIKLYWTIKTPASVSVIGYNLYRSPSSNGNYAKINNNIIPYTFYLDDGNGVQLLPLTTYYYRLTVVDVNGNESAAFPFTPTYYPASTSLKLHPGTWPLSPASTIPPNRNITGRAEGSPVVYDLFGDGFKEIFFTTGAIVGQGGVWAFKHDGTRWYSFDPTPANKNGYINLQCYTTATPAIGDIDMDGKVEMAVNTKPIDNNLNQRKLFSYEMPTTQNYMPVLNNLPASISGWDSPKGSVFSDIDADGNMEILVANLMDEWGRNGGVKIFNSNGSAHTGWPSNNTTGYTPGVSMPVAFDFDNLPDNKKEIVIGCSGSSFHGAGIYIFNEDGTDFSSNPVYTPAAGFRCDFPPVVADIDNDGSFEIIFIAAKYFTANIFAMKSDGTLLAGWNNASHPSFTLSSSVLTNAANNNDEYFGGACPTLSVGDINKDGLPEVVCGDNGHLYVWGNDFFGGMGVLLASINIPGYTSQTLKAPILADVDNDPTDLEIIVTNNITSPEIKTNIYAYKLINGQGQLALAGGFPITIDEAVSNSPCVDDIDKDGVNELIVITPSMFYVWDTFGDATNNIFGWTSYRHDSYNSGIFRQNDLWIKDVPSDIGLEPDPPAPWNMVDGIDVWVRNAADNLTINDPPHYAHEHQHENAEWSSAWANDPNSVPRIYVKVRNRGNTTVSGYLHLYYHALTTNDRWGSCTSGLCGSWKELICDDINGDGTINGSESNVCLPNHVTISPGGEWTVEQPWYVAKHFANPAITGNRKQYCLLARLVCDNGFDPIVNEQINRSAGWNAKESNNIVQKNVVFVDNIKGINAGGNPPYYMDFGNVSAGTTVNRLEFVQVSPIPFSEINGSVSIDLGDSLYNAWASGGFEGTGISESIDTLHPYTIELLSDSASIENISLAPFEMHPIYVKFNYYPGDSSSIPYEYQFRQSESFNLIDPDYNFTGAVKFYLTKPNCPEAYAGSDITISQGQNANLTGSPVIENAIYEWFDNLSGQLVDTGAVIIVSPPATTIYMLKISSPEGCISSDEVVVYETVSGGIVIPISNGWSLISSYLEPINPSMEYLFTEMVSQNKLVVMLGKNGIFWPSGSINTIGDWDVYQGYKIKMNEPGSIEVIGEIPEDKTITLNAGANYIPVLSAEYYPANDIFAQLGSGLIFAYDLSSESLYWPAGGIFTLQVLEPGKGYLVGMSQSGQATYDPLLKSDFKDYIPVKPKVYENAPWKVAKTGSPHLISINRSALAGFEPGDFIGVFNAGGMCAGMSRIDKSESNLLLVAYGNDFTMKTATGLADGETMQFKVYRASTMVETHADVSFDAAMPNMGLFAENGMSKIIKIKTGATSVDEAVLSDIYIYPNPSDGTFTIEGVDRKVNIKIVNILGDQVYSGEVDLPSKLDLSSQPKGVYFISIETDNSKFFKKLIIN